MQIATRLAARCRIQSDFARALDGLPLEYGDCQFELFDIELRAGERQRLAERDASQQDASFRAARDIRALRINVGMECAIRFQQMSILPTTIVRRILFGSGDRLDELPAGSAKLLCRQAGGVERKRRGERDGNRHELAGIVATIPEATLNVIEDSGELAESGVAATHQRGVAGRDGRAHRATIRAAATDQRGVSIHACPRVD